MTMKPDGSYIPYETLARSAAGDIAQILPSNLQDLNSSQRCWLKELLVISYMAGLDDGFAMSEFAGVSPSTSLDAFNAGIVEGKRTKDNN